MSHSPIAVAVLGEGPVAALLARRIDARPDLVLTAACASSEAPPAGTDCVVYLPTSAELAAGTAARRVTGLLREGIDVVSTAPAAALAGADLMGACREGGATYHGTGGFQSSLAVRFQRAFAAITRDVRRVELLEELDVEDPPAHPWASVADAGIGEEDPAKVTARAAVTEAYYDAGLHTLSEAVFGDAHLGEGVSWSAAPGRGEEGPQRARVRVEEATERVVVRRDLGGFAAYDSVWTRRQGSAVPLRYRLKTETGDAVGRATLTFRADGEVRPAAHLTCVGLLDAIAPVHASAPGVLHHDLDIDRVKLDDRLSR